MQQVGVYWTKSTTTSSSVQGKIYIRIIEIKRSEIREAALVYRASIHISTSSYKQFLGIEIKVVNKGGSEIREVVK